MKQKERSIVLERILGLLYKRGSDDSNDDDLSSDANPQMSEPPSISLVD